MTPHPFAVLENLAMSILMSVRAIPTYQVLALASIIPIPQTTSVSLILLDLVRLRPPKHSTALHQIAADP